MEEFLNPVEELFVIGNGFDLRCGLETSYYNFITYIFTCYFPERQEDIVEECERKLSKTLELKSFDKRILTQYSNLMLSPSINIWYSIFLFEKLNKSSNWNSVEEIILKYISAESLIKKVFMEIQSLKSQSTPNVLLKNGLFSISQTKKEKDIVSWVIFSLITKDLGKLKLEKKQYYVDLRKYIVNEKILENGEVKELITSILLNELHELEYDFECFLRHRLEVSTQYPKKVSWLLETMLKNKQVISGDLVVKPYNLISFNYSSFWNLYPNAKFNPKSYSDIHGRLPKDNIPISNIIFGIDHDGIEATSLEYRFTKTYRTLQLYSRNFEGVGENRDIFVDSIKKIKFYGHSLAEADYSYFQQMFDYFDLL